MSERRYTEDEVATIFERAAQVRPAPGNSIAAASGHTLAELQEIGREVGIAPEAVALAARSVDGVAAGRTPRFLGVPIGVERTVELGRALSDHEWERLVVDLRETFQARGRMRSEGSFRQWTNGNLQALVEPTATGQRLRLRTLKGSARQLMTMGLTMLGGSGAVLLAEVITGGAAHGALNGVAVIAVTGLGALTAGVLQVPAWARRRREQMEAIAARLSQAALEEGRGDAAPPSLPSPD